MERLWTVSGPKPFGQAPNPLIWLRITIPRSMRYWVMVMGRPACFWQDTILSRRSSEPTAHILLKASSDYLLQTLKYISCCKLLLQLSADGIPASQVRKSTKEKLTKSWQIHVKKVYGPRGSSFMGAVILRWKDSYTSKFKVDSGGQLTPFLEHASALAQRSIITV